LFGLLGRFDGSVAVGDGFEGVERVDARCAVRGERDRPPSIVVRRDGGAQARGVLGQPPERLHVLSVVLVVVH